MKKIFNFIKGVFLDDENEPCVGRVALILGIVISAFTIVFGITGDVSWAEMVLRASPSIIGLGAYIFTRLCEMREWIADNCDVIAGAITKTKRTEK